MNTHDMGSRFGHKIRLRTGTPFLHTGVTHEVDPPFRAATPKIIRLIPIFRRPASGAWGLLLSGWWGIAVGRWQAVERTEAEAIQAAMRGHLSGPPQKFDPTTKSGQAWAAYQTAEDVKHLARFAEAYGKTPADVLDISPIVATTP